MTSSITPITTTSSGDNTTTTTTTTTATEHRGTPAKPEQGIARLREIEVYHLTSLVESALSEAGRMVRQVHDPGQGAFPWTTTTAVSRWTPMRSAARSATPTSAPRWPPPTIDKAVMGLLDGGRHPSDPRVPGLEGAHPPARPATKKPIRSPYERGEWRASRYQHPGGRSCVGRRAATRTAARCWHHRGSLIMLAGAVVAAKIGPVVAEVLHLAVEVLHHHHADVGTALR